MQLILPAMVVLAGCRQASAFRADLHHSSIHPAHTEPAGTL